MDSMVADSQSLNRFFLVFSHDYWYSFEPNEFQDPIFSTSKHSLAFNI